jgi:hypothetical protein
MSTSPLWLTGDPSTDVLLTSDPNALLLGMVLDQHFAGYSRAMPHVKMPA